MPTDRPTDHNRLHAADVLHAVYYLTSQPIDNFCQVPLDLIDQYDNLLASTKRPNSDDEFASKLHNHIVAVVVAAAAAAADSELPFGIMGANLTALEVMALYTAAAMHDFQHPGRTNSFLVATNSPLVSTRRRPVVNLNLNIVFPIRFVSFRLVLFRCHSFVGRRRANG